MNFSGQTIGVVGLGASGLATARWLSRHGADLVVADSRDVPPNQAELARLAPKAVLRTGAFSAATFADCDQLVVSPGVPLATPFGVMEGSYTLQDESGQQFEAPIAPFTLAVPNIIN